MSEGTLKLSDFLLSEKTGAVLEGNLDRLPRYFDEWNRLADQFVYLWNEKRLREGINKLPLLDHTKLASHKERVLAHLHLAFFCTGYIFNDESNIVNVIPKSVAVPLCGVSESLGVQPYPSYFSFILGNIVTKNPEGNKTTVFALPGDREWCDFVTNNAEVEACAGPIFVAIISGMEALAENDVETLTECLSVIKQELDKMKDVFKLLSNVCSPKMFTLFAKLFRGSGKNQPNPNGIIFEGVSKTPKEFISTNASQTPTFQIIDEFLGIEHSEQNEKHLEMLRTYMLPAHRCFVMEVKKRPRVRTFVASQQNEKLTNIYHECLSSLTDFRSFHIQMVTRYVINTMSPGERKPFTEDKQGPLSFIKTVRDTTKTSAIK